MLRRENNISLLTVRKWLNKRPIKRKSLIDDYEAKNLNTYMKYMIYYPNFNLTNISKLLGSKIHFEIYKDMKILDIGVCFGFNWCFHPKVSEFNLEIVDQSLLNIKLTQKKLLAKGVTIPVRQMDYAALQYDRHFLIVSFQKLVFKYSLLKNKKSH